MLQQQGLIIVYKMLTENPKVIYIRLLVFIRSQIRNENEWISIHK